MGEISTKAPSGFRDFSPKEATKRASLIHKIEEQYTLHGFQRIMTSTCENLSNLEGKGVGIENEHLIFKIQKRGKAFEEAVSDILKDNATVQESIQNLSRHTADLALRPELTLPLARYVSQFRNELTFPLKLFQIAPVWRAERPQKGRYREFLQCDVDMLGCQSIGAELDCLGAMLAAIQSFDIGDIKLKLNDRRLINAVGEKLNIPPPLYKEILISLDKLPKIGQKALEKELKEKIPSDMLEELKCYFFQEESKNLDYWKDTHQEGVSALQELSSLLTESTAKGNTVKIEFEPSLVRGQDYYTGTIFELEIEASNPISIAAGGRYDNLLKLFGSPNTPAFGASIGFERVFLAILEKEAKENDCSAPKLFFPLFDESKRKFIIPILKQLRERKISCELYPEPVKIKKQFKYANAKNIPWSISLGDEELEKKVLGVKNMETGEETSIPMETFAERMEKTCNER